MNAGDIRNDDYLAATWKGELVSIQVELVTGDSVFPKPGVLVFRQGKWGRMPPQEIPGSFPVTLDWQRGIPKSNDSSEIVQPAGST